MAHSPDKRAQTRRRGRGTNNNLRRWQLQQAGAASDGALPVSKPRNSSGRSIPGRRNRSAWGIPMSLLLRADEASGAHCATQGFCFAPGAVGTGLHQLRRPATAGRIHFGWREIRFGTGIPPVMPVSSQRAAWRSQPPIGGSGKTALIAFAPPREDALENRCASEWRGTL